VFMDKRNPALGSSRHLIKPWPLWELLILVVRSTLIVNSSFAIFG
jgi:hypothetical protein